MFNDLGFNFKGTTLLLMLSSLALTLSQIISMTWCNTSGPYFGYFYNQDHQLQSCTFGMPGQWLFLYGALALNALGLINLLSDGFRAREKWLATKSINLSRTAFVVSLISINSLLELLTHRFQRPDHETFFDVFYDNFFFLFPLALLLLIVSSWSIQQKVELYFTLNKRRR